MAASGGERRMVFDIRGRRRHVVKVVYAVLALLMGASLFLVVGPVNIGSLLGGNESSNVTAQYEEQAQRIERKLTKSPEDPELLIGLMRARINTSNSLAATNPETEEVAQTPESLQQLELASEAWSRYRKATDEPSAGTAIQIAGTLYTLAQYSRTGSEFEANMRGAAQAQQLVAEQRPSKGSYSTLTIYNYYAQNFRGAARARRKTETYAHSRFEKENLGNELDTFAKRGHEIQKQLAEIKKSEEKARAKGEAPTANPLAESNPLATPGSTAAP
jgi:hypothetical protein